jgi:hypothetical protein
MHDTENSYDKISYASVEYTFEPFGVETWESSMETNKTACDIKTYNKMWTAEATGHEIAWQISSWQIKNPLFRGCIEQ